MLPNYKRDTAYAQGLEEFYRGLTSQDDYVDPRWKESIITWAVERMGIRREFLVWSMNEAFNDHTWDGDPDPIVKIADAITDWHHVGVQSAISTGKTFFLALIVLWGLDCFPGIHVITVAPKEDQLRLHVWKEISRLFPQFQSLHPKAKMYDSLRIQMRPHRKDWFAEAFVCGVSAEEAMTSASRARGFHAKYMMFIVEETTGVNGAIMRALRNTCTAPHNIVVAVGNPDSELDELNHHCELPHVVAVRISGHDHPNVVMHDPLFIEGAVTEESLENLANEFGEDSAMYGAQGRGICPAQSAESLFTKAMLERSYQRWRMKRQTEGAAAMGVDVANSPTGDSGVIARGDGARLEELFVRACPDANLWGSQEVWPRMQEFGITSSFVGVDIVGVGVGCFNELKRLGQKVVALNAGIPPLGNEKLPLKNLRAQMYWQLYRDLRDDLVDLPKDDRLWRELLAVRWERKEGYVMIWPKEKIKKLLKGKSPDAADAVVMWNWVRRSRYRALGQSAMINI